MPNWVLTGVIAGLAAALMQGAMLHVSLLSIIVFYLSPLPLFIAGFGRGWASAAIGALVATVVLFVATSSPGFSLSFLVSAGLAPVVAAGLSMISRNAAAAAREGEARSGDREWYPEGRLILWLAAISAGVTIISIVTIARDYAGYTTVLTKLVGQLLAAYEKAAPSGTPPLPKQPIVSAVITLLPVAAASTWLLATVTSMRLAIVMLAKAGRQLRPWAPFAKLAFPRSAVAVLLVSLAASYFLTGYLQLFANAVTAAFFAAFAVLGLAVVHALVAGLAARPFILGVVYAGLVFLNWVMALPLALLAIADLNFNFRKPTQIQSQGD